VVVTDISPDSPVTGLLQVNDVIQEGTVRISRAQDYDQAVAKIGKRMHLLLI
jgi:hypothetical protein